MENEIKEFCKNIDIKDIKAQYLDIALEDVERMETFFGYTYSCQYDKLNEIDLHIQDYIEAGLEEDDPELKMNLEEFKANVLRIYAREYARILLDDLEKFTKDFEYDNIAHDCCK